MSPELLVPSRFGFTESIPTPEADIYAFELVIYQVCDHDRRYPQFAYIFQVLMGKLPSPGLGMIEIALDVVQGVRLTKPQNASAIGFSDSLWSFVQRCWDGEMKLQPKVAGVVSQLGRAAAGWGEVLESPTEPQTTSTLSQCTGSSSAEVREVAFSRSELASGGDAVVKDDHPGRWRASLCFA